MPHRVRFLLMTLALIVPLASLSSRSRGAGAEEAKLPDTPAGRQLSAWLRAFHTGEADALRRFMTEQFAASAAQQGPPEERAIRGAALYRDTRGFAIRRVERSSDTEIALLVETKLTEEWFRLELQVEPAAPHRITNFSVRPAMRPLDAGPQEKPSDREIAAKLDAYLKKLVDADLFSGGVLVARDGKPVYKKAFGFASQAYRVPNRVDTKFNLGSMNKMFTAVAILQLAEQGKLALTDPIRKHLPEYPNSAAAEKVTIHHLLTHTSGLGDYFNERWEARKFQLRTVADFLPLFAEDPLLFEPGARWQYSNAGFVVLGAIIEKLSGKSYFDTVRDQITRPAGMNDTASYELDRDTPNLAMGYTRMELDGRMSTGPRRNNLFMHVIKGGPAGGGFSTVEDLLRFDIALRSHKLLSAKSTEILLAGKADTPWGAKYAYGFEDQRVNGKRIVGHGGGFPGINGQLDIYLDSGYTVAVLANMDPPAAQRVANRLRELLTAG
jgi:CubicO group peptidase (beta-lactamase class C family)